MLNELRSLIDSITTNELHVNHRVNFIEISKKKLKTFLLYDQINKKFGSEIFIMNENVLKTAVKFEVEKKKVFESNRYKGKIKRVHLYFFKEFYLIFLEKKA